MVKKEGMFVFEGFVSAIETLRSDTQKWRMFRAVYNYEVHGVEPPEVIKKSGIFMLIRAIIDGKKTKSLARSKKEEDESKVKEVDEVGFEDCFCGAEKIDENGASRNEEVGVNALYNENKNENKNEKMISSLIGDVLVVKKNSGKSMQEKQNVCPDFGEVADFIEKSGAEVDPKLFFEFYDQKKWRVEGKPVRDWKSLVVAWSVRAKKDVVASGLDLGSSSKKLKDNLSEAEFNRLMTDSLDDVEF